MATTWTPTGQSTGFSYQSNAEDQITGVTQTSDAAITTPPGANQKAAFGNALNQITQLGAFPLTWDADGELSADANRTYGWDAENRLLGVGFKAVAGKGTSLAYDGLGRRIQIMAGSNSANQVTTNYIWCGGQLCQARNAQGQVIRSYYPEGEYVTAGQSARYYAPDNLGSVRRVFTAAGASAYDYDPSGVLVQGGPTTQTDYTWAGLFNEPVSGLYLAANRPYDPVTGRFIARDPLGEGTDPEGNLYPYAANDPINANDPLGLAATDGPSAEEPPGSGEAVGGNADPSAASAGLSVVTRPGMMVRVVNDVNGNPVPIYGQPGSSPTTPGHAEAIEAQAQSMAASGNYKYVLMQRSLGTATNRLGGRNIANVTGVQNNDVADLFEVQSKTDDPEALLKRMEESLKTLPEESRGDTIVLQCKP